MSIPKTLAPDELEHIRLITHTACTLRDGMVIGPDNAVYHYIADDERSYRAALARVRAAAEKASVT